MKLSPFCDEANNWIKWLMQQSIGKDLHYNNCIKIQSTAVSLVSGWNSLFTSLKSENCDQLKHLQLILCDEKGNPLVFRHCNYTLELMKQDLDVDLDLMSFQMAFEGVSIGTSSVREYTQQLLVLYHVGEMMISRSIMTNNIDDDACRGADKDKLNQLNLIHHW